MRSTAILPMLVIDGGFGKNEASTIVDCTGDEIEVIRQGLGILEL